MKSNFETVLEYIRQDEGVRTVDLAGHQYGWLNNNLCMVFYVFTGVVTNYSQQNASEIRWVISDIPLNHFVALCDKMTKSEIEDLRIQSAFTAVLSNRKNRH